MLLTNVHYRQVCNFVWQFSVHNHKIEMMTLIEETHFFQALSTLNRMKVERNSVIKIQVAKGISPPNII